MYKFKTSWAFAWFDKRWTWFVFDAGLLQAYPANSKVLHTFDGRHTFGTVVKASILCANWVSNFMYFLSLNHVIINRKWSKILFKMNLNYILKSKKKKKQFDNIIFFSYLPLVNAHTSNSSLTYLIIVKKRYWCHQINILCNSIVCFTSNLLNIRIRFWW